MSDAVFQQAFIPRKLDEVTHFERDRERLAAGHSSEGIYYQVGAGPRAYEWVMPLLLWHMCQCVATTPPSLNRCNSLIAL